MLCLDSPDWKGTQTRSQSEEPTYGWWVWSLHPRETEGERESDICTLCDITRACAEWGKCGHSFIISGVFTGRTRTLIISRKHWGRDVFAYYGTFNGKESEFGIRMRFLSQTVSLETQFKTLQVQIGFIFIHSKTLSRRTNIRTWQY